ncbi:hypothetical protein H7J86_32505 [Mycobacterium hackensackense]|uniref:hypothetical protein n=1 Tax=Mycobacterium hackensackense TaxID=228909 RepID=UPI002265BBD7|nr:hypothetical protein [Mycobacterium hackensackense]MCV7256907.1 hypothetical protein [Mycobacterium hackensackense]
MTSPLRATAGGRHRAVPVRSIGDRGRWVRLGVAAGMTALLVPVAGLVIPLTSADPAVMAQASATPKPGSAGGNHSKPGDNKKKKKTDNKKSNNNRQGSSARSSSSDSGAQHSGSSFSERTNANNRWSADGANRSVNTRVSSQAEPQPPAQAPSQVQEAPPTQGQQNTGQPATPPQDTTPAQTSPPAAQQQTPTVVIPAQGEYAPGEQTTTTVTPAAPNDPTGPATALVIGLAAAGAGAASRRNGSRSSSTPSTATDPTQGVRGGFSVTHIGQTDGDQTLVTLTDPSSPTRYNFDASQVVPDGGSLQVNPDQTVSILDASGTATGDGFSAPWARDATGAAQPTQFTAQGTTLTQTITPRPDAVYPITADPDGIKVDDSAINSPTPPMAPPAHPDDPLFGQSDMSTVERVLSGTAGRADGATAVGYLQARGWDTAANLIGHYLANESGSGDSSLARDFQLSTAETDALGADPYNGGYGADKVASLPDLLQQARTSALTAAATSGQPTYTEVFGNAGGWTEVAGSTPTNIYATGRYSAQIVTQVQNAGTPQAVIQQRFYVYDFTDFDHNSGTITNIGALTSNPMEAGKMTVIDELSTLRDIGYARAFNTYGVSSIQTFLPGQ